MKLILARHATTGEKFSGRYVGSTDVPLCGEGIEQAHLLAKAAAFAAPARIFCSPLLRARQTADIVAHQVGRGYEILDDLREIDFGRWERLSFAEICLHDQALVDLWGRNAAQFQFPDGEANSDFRDRVQRSLHTLIAQPESPLLVVSHGGVIRAMICQLLGLDYEKYLLFEVQPAKMAVLELFGDKGVLTGFNI